MASSRDGESETGRNIHRGAKRAREESSCWRPQASRELLRLRFRTLRALFDEAQTVADVHEAWGVLASRLNARGGLDEAVDAVKCSDHLTRLRRQWQGSSTAQLHLMMAECFAQQAPAARSNFNSAMEEAERADASPKRKKTPAVAAPTGQTEVATSRTEAPAAQEEAPLRREPPSPPQIAAAAPVCPQPGFQAQQEAASPDELEASASPEQQAPLSPQPPRQVEAQPGEEGDDFPRQDEVLRALEERSEQLERLAQSHQQLADITRKVVEALVTRQSRTV
ncbi:hypothetical protein PHYPSEUDO_000243 [Phytophthora pseudosyringae]|uniref:Uncharacterized protein n=1 Tax=Phytophthora pseudosyringae TaxID=221518 RepID=A0A8T1WH55_9STRA|nr:hypothetical protein PHYPSEUDO_000243 [Phytophthora pseudosyringae]